MKRLAVIGHPISHSRSPLMQNAALRELGLAGEWRYEALDIEPQVLPKKLRALAANPDFVGLNVTVPHKQAALELAGSSSRAAREIGAANTLVFGDGGAIHAENTDAPGLIDAIPSSVADKHALVLGAGGAARAVVWALANAGARVAIWARRPEAAAKLSEQIAGRVWRNGPISDFDLIVNASAAGLGDGAALPHLPLAGEDLHAGQIVVDMVYGEKPTDLMLAAERSGCQLVDGLEILVCQGARSLEIWTAKRAPLEVMRRAVREGPASA